MIRVLHKTGNTITDHSKALIDYNAGSMTLSSFGTSDAIYIGDINPSNHKYFKFDTANTDASVLDLKLWDGTNFIDLAELRDDTSLSSAAFGQSEFVTWVPDKDLTNWSREDTEDIDDLSTIKIYDLYWVKITTSINMTSGFVLDWVGNLFSNDQDLYTEYPIFNRAAIQALFSTSDWQRQIQKAAEIIIDDLQKKGIIEHEGQIVEREQLNLASTHRTAQIIFGSMGDDYEDDRVKAKRDYEDRLARGIYRIDTNKNATLDISEHNTKTGWLNR